MPSGNLSDEVDEVRNIVVMPDLSPLVEQDSHFAMKVCQYGEVTYPRNYCI